MKKGQFYKGMINGVETTYESPDILQVLPQDKLSEFWDREQIGTYRRIFLSERLIVQTVISKAESDVHGRDGIVNHTVFYRFDAYVEHEGARYRFDSNQFAEDAYAGRYNFKIPPTPELKQPLDYPPDLEEVKP